MSAAEVLNYGVAVELDRPRPLKLTFWSLAHLEQVLPINALDLAAVGELFRSGSVQTRCALLWSLLLLDDPTLTLAQLTELMTFQRLVRVQQPMWQAFTQAVVSSADEPSALPEPDASGSSASRLSWLEVWAIARYDLALSEAEFWALSPVKFHALCRRLRTDEQRQDYRSGVLAALIVNVNTVKGQGKAPADFFPSLAPPSPKAPKDLTKEERQAAAKAFFAGLGGQGRAADRQAAQQTRAAMRQGVESGG